MKKRKMNLILILFLILLFISLGYAYLSTNLAINGTADLDSNTWNVFWDNVQVTTGSVTGTQVTQSPTIDTNKTTVSFRINLKEPGEFYEFTVDAKNTGSIDAMIDTISKTSNLPAYLDYQVTYDDGVEIESYYKLTANSVQKYKIRVEYNEHISSSQLPSSNQSVTVNFGVEYVQANSNAVVKPTYMYSNYSSEYLWDRVVVNYNSEKPSAVPFYDSPSNTNITSNQSNIYLRHLMRGNIVLSSNVCFIINFHGNNVNYCVKANNYSNLSQEEKTKITSLFGSNNCTDSGTYLDCIVSPPYLHFSASSNRVQVQGQVREVGWLCEASSSENYSGCVIL